jgi:hypothetical protein
VLTLIACAHAVIPAAWGFLLFSSVLALHPQHRPPATFPHSTAMSTLTWPPVPGWRVRCGVSDGFCVSERYGVVVVANAERSTLDVHALADGSFLHSVGSHGCGADQLSLDISGVCLTASGDAVLVADTRNHRIQHVAISDWSFVRSVGARTVYLPLFVDYNSTHIVVCEDCDRIGVLAWSDGRWLASFCTTGSGACQLRRPRGVQLMTDGSGFFVADHGNNRIVVFDLTSDGRSVRQRVQGCVEGVFGVQECRGSGSGGVGDHRIIACSPTTGQLFLLTADRLEVIDAVDDDVDVTAPRTVCALSDGGLVVLDGETTRCRLLMFKGLCLRMAWLTVCVVNSA